MLVRSLALRNYGPFQDATFDLTTTAAQPLILFTGNNGAGKTTTIDALRLGIHGRRGFQTPISDADFRRYLLGRFHDGDLSATASIEVILEYAESGLTHNLLIRRDFTAQGNNVLERVYCEVDGTHVAPGISAELVLQVFPPELVPFFFFDAERIAELAEWESDNDSRLFSSVDAVLGLGIAEQLGRDLERIVITSARADDGERLVNASAGLGEFEEQLEVCSGELSLLNAQLAAAHRRREQSQQRLRAFGGVLADERASLEAAILHGKRTISEIDEKLRDEAAHLLPLLAVPELIARVRCDLELSEQLEEGNAIARAFKKREPEIAKAIHKKFPEVDNQTLLAVIRDLIVPKPIVIDHAPPDLSLREISWIRSILSNDLPKLTLYITSLLRERQEAESALAMAQATLAQAPKGDPVVDGVLQELTDAQRDQFRLEGEVDAVKERILAIRSKIHRLTEEIKVLRNTQFREQRFAKSDALLKRLRTALPDYANRLRAMKQEAFAGTLYDFLTILWNKEGRLNNVDVNLATRTVTLSGPSGEIIKSDLSAAEKQLFSLAFIFALAKLAARSFPFAIDTPLGRLDRSHRTRLLLDFLPQASHQTILFSTDTEITGELYANSKHLISRHYELADYNANITAPVDLGLAL